MQEEKDVSFVQDPKTWYKQVTLQINQIIIIMILVILESESGTRAKVFYGSTSSLRAV